MTQDGSIGVAAHRAITRIPVVLLTGFLGSGKTTLIKSILTSQAPAKMAVIVNELGAVGLDHTLMWQSDGVVELVENGCVCCDVGEDLLGTMEQLFYARLHRKIPKFERLVIETTGVADPRPIAQALRAHPLVNERFRLVSVMCTVDATQAPERLLDMPEALAQAAFSDVVFLTKGDLADAQTVAAWKQRLEHINPAANVVSLRSDAWPPGLMEEFERERPPRRPESRIKIGASALRHSARRAVPDAIRSLTVHLPNMVSAAALSSAFETVADQLGERLLRLKGIAHVLGESKPVVVQAVGARMSPFEACPMSDASGFLVLIFLGTTEEAEQAERTLQVLSICPTQGA